jgi:hypothetical protein
MLSRGGGTVTGIRRPEAPGPRGPNTIGFIISALTFIGLLVMLAVVMPTMMGIHQIVCDGVVERWMIPEDYSGGGCVTLPPWWEHLVPGHNTERVCLTACLLEVTPGHS